MTMRSYRQLKFLLLLLLMPTLSSRLAGQNPSQPVAATNEAKSVPPPLTVGSIKGRVLDSEGQPVPNIPVTASAMGRRAPGRPGMFGQSAQGMTDDEGNFYINGLLPASYSISSAAPGYVTIPPDDESSAGFYHVGDFAQITLSKGGVVTGKVLNAEGEPLTGVNIEAVRVGNLEGEPDLMTIPNGFGRNWRTDDLGVYRIYGLAPGSYMIRAGGRADAGPNFASAFSEDAPTYYPSATRETATVLQVRAGAELGGLDIRYRGEKGHAISGKVIAKAGSEGNGFGGIQINLSAPGSDAIVAAAFQMGGGGRRGINNNNGFSLRGIPDGDYEISARSANFGNVESDSASPTRRVSVHGADISGIELLLAPLATLNGRVTIDRKAGAAVTANPAAPAADACSSPRRSFMGEILLNALPEDRSHHEAPAIGRFGRMQYTAPNSNGEFTLRNLEAGVNRVIVQLPDEGWYLRSMNLDRTPGPATRKTAAAASPVINVGRNGITFKPGEKISGLLIGVAEGAAGVKGQVTKAGGEKIADHRLVHLIPAEKEAADNLLRYAQTLTTRDGSFNFKHLAPGRYYLLTKPLPKEVAEYADDRLIAWDNAKRLALRREAEAAGKVIELQPCQRMNGYQLNSGEK